MNKGKYIIKLYMLVMIMLLGSRVVANTTINEFESALKEVAYSYYMRGNNIQYNSMKVGYFSPEDATFQNTNYLVCSGYTRNVYRELLGITIPEITTQLMSSARDNIGNPEVILYGKKDSSGNIIMNFYDENSEYKVLEVVNPNFETDILPRLRCGDVLTYTGHTILIYDLIYDEHKNVVDAYVIHSAHGQEKKFFYTKLPREVSLSESLSFGAINHRLWYSKIYNMNYNDYKNDLELATNIEEGSLNLSKLSDRRQWRYIDDNTKNTEEYSALRFVQDNGSGYVVFKGLNDSKNNIEDDTNVVLPEKTKNRVKYDKLFIEKTIDAFHESHVQPGQELIYHITIKNNSNHAYRDSIEVIENIGEYVEYKSFISDDNVEFYNNLDENHIKWIIKPLESLEEVNIEYKVKVKRNSLNQVIESSGTVAGIPSGILKNKVNVDFTKLQKLSIAEKYDELVENGMYSGKELINEIYKQALNIDLRIDRF